MKFEQPPNLPPKSKKETMEFNGQQFEVEKPVALSVNDIQPGDRVMVTTESGNRYMLRRSKSANGAIKIYNEKADGFKQGYEFHGQGEIAKVGSKFDFTIRLSKDSGKKYHATQVVGIEIRRGIDTAIENYARENKGGDGNFGQILAEGIKSRFQEKESSDHEDKDAKFLDKHREK